MNKYEEQVKECHTALEVAIGEDFSVDLLKLRKRLLEEELSELNVEIDSAIEAISSGKKVDRDLYLKMVKELADLQYVLSGFAVSFGIDLQEIFDLVHESNMSKLDDNGKPIKREDGKFLKGPNYHLPKFDNIKYE